MTQSVNITHNNHIYMHNTNNFIPLSIKSKSDLHYYITTLLHYYITTLLHYYTTTLLHYTQLLW